ncbi:hypothetical protein KVM25_04925 [Helicobacter pylori]|nr:hypothetical protein KVM25_04925 [Helicobacter pylori]
MPKKELLKMSKKRIFKDFFKEVKQHRPIVFYTDNDCDGMLAGSVLMSMCYRIKCFFKDKDLSLAQDDLDGISNLYGFNCINYINALSRLSGAREFKGCYDSYLHYLVLKHFNPISDPRLSVFNVKEFKRYNDIKKKMVKENEESAQIFSYNKILVAILDESCSVKWGISGLVANNFLKKYPFNRSLCIYKDNKDGYSGSARGDGNFLSQIKTIPLIQARGHEEAFGLSFAKENFKKVIKSLQAL